MSEPDSYSEMLVVYDLLSDAEKYGLQSEVVYFALKYMKENPNLTILEAITYGYDEWVK